MIFFFWCKRVCVLWWWFNLQCYRSMNSLFLCLCLCWFTYMPPPKKAPAHANVVCPCIYVSVDICAPPHLLSRVRAELQYDLVEEEHEKEEEEGGVWRHPPACSFISRLPETRSVWFNHMATGGYCCSDVPGPANKFAFPSSKGKQSHLCGGRAQLHIMP